MKLSIIIPVYNEEKTVGEIIKRVEKEDLGKVEKEIIVVDDGSSDQSVAKIKNHTSTSLSTGKSKIKNLILIRHDKNLGKGAAVQTGLKHATGDIVLIQDADLE